MKLTLVYIAAATLLADTALAFRLPAILTPRQQQPPPQCSLYTGLKDSPSFTSFCKQLPGATKAATANGRAATSSSTQKTISISTERFTFDGGATSTLAPIEPVISSAAASNTYVMQRYTITTSGVLSNGKAAATTSSAPASNTGYEVHCYLSGSKLPMSECTRTAGLTRHHGYTYTHDTISGMPTVSSQSLKTIPTSSAKAPSSSSAVSSNEAVSSSQPVSSSKSASASKSSSNAAVKPAGGSTTSAPSLPSSEVASGKPTSTSCTNTNNLTRHHGYTFSDTLTLVRSTANLTSSVVASASIMPTTSSVAVAMSSSAIFLSNKATTSSKAFATGSGVPPSYGSSYNCGNITGAEPYRMGASAPVRTASQTPSLVTVSKSPAASSNAAAPSSGPASSAAIPTSSAALSRSSTMSTSYVNSYDCNNITAAEPHRQGSYTVAESMSSGSSTASQSEAASSAQTTPFEPVAPNAKCQQTSTTTVVDATVTTIVPCPTDVEPHMQPAEQKRDLSFMQDSTDKLCDAGVYCVNSTFVSDAPPSWHWDAVELKKGQTCLEDDVFNTIGSSCSALALDCEGFNRLGMNGAQGFEGRKRR